MAKGLKYQKARDAIDAAGGLVSQTSLAKHWGVGVAYINECKRLPQREFPKPAARVGNSDLWLLNEVQEWRDARQKTREDRARRFNEKLIDEATRNLDRLDGRL